MNNINNDTNLHEAVCRREQQLPPMPTDLNERLMQRLQERRMSDGTSEIAGTAPKFSNRRIRLYAAVAASILLIIGIGAMKLKDKPIREEASIAENVAFPPHVDVAQPRPSLQGEGLGVGSLTSTPSESIAENRHEKRLQTPPRPSGSLPSFGGRQRGARVAARSSAIRNGRGVAAHSSVKHELPDTLGSGIWQSERNVVRALQMLGECEAVIEKSEQEVRNTIVRATFNATPQPANAVLVTNEAGDCEVIETKTIIEI